MSKYLYMDGMEYFATNQQIFSYFHAEHEINIYTAHNNNEWKR